MKESHFLIDAEHVAEMARLIKQAQSVTEELGLVPASQALLEVRESLDVAGGPGE
jgi:hypothetical protein